jgi:hypothetical protein
LCPLLYLRQAHSREERDGISVILNEPFSCLLEYTLTRQSVCLQNSVQAGLGSSRLIPTIEQFDPSFTNTGNQFAVEIDIGNVGTCNDFSIIQLEVFACFDSSVHLKFDLAHGGFPLNKCSMARDGGHHKESCASSGTGTLETTLIEVSIAEDLTIHQFERTKLIGENITFSVNPIITKISSRTTIAAQIETIFLDGLHQLPETNQVRITLSGDLFTSTNAGVDLLFDLCQFLTLNKGHSLCHLTGKVTNFLHIIECLLIVKNVCLRLNEQDIIIAVDLIINRTHNLSVLQSTTAHVFCMGSDDDRVTNYLRKLIRNGVRSVFGRTTKPDKVTLIDELTTGQILQAGTQNLNQTCLSCFIIEGKHVLLSITNLDLFLIKYAFRSDEKVTRRRIGAPNNSGSTVNLHAEITTSSEPIQHGKITVQDRIFGVLKVKVFHRLFAC